MHLCKIIEIMLPERYNELDLLEEADKITAEAHIKNLGPGYIDHIHKEPKKHFEVHYGARFVADGKACLEYIRQWSKLSSIELSGTPSNAVVIGNKGQDFFHYTSTPQKKEATSHDSQKSLATTTH